MQTDDGLTYGVFTPAGATLRELIVQNELAVPEASLHLSKVSGLTAALEGKATLEALDYERDIRIAIQGQIAGTAAALGYTQQDLVDLTGVVASKASGEELTNGLLTRATVS